MIELQQWDADAAQNAMADLAEMLHASVAHGASIGFVMPFTLEQARAFWQAAAGPGAGERAMLVALANGRPVGTVQLLLAMPDNGRHRAEVVKLMVHPQARRQGIARLLMQEVQALAARHRRSLLVLDTLSGSAAQGCTANWGSKRQVTSRNTPAPATAERWKPPAICTNCCEA